MKYLFIGAHVDDTDLSCGGTMIKLVEHGHNVHNMALSMCGEVKLWAEFESSSAVMGTTNSLHNFTVREFHNYRQKLAEFFYTIRNDYDFVVTHSVSDKHLDHRVVAEESARVFAINSLTYIGPWNGDENPNHFVELSPQQLEKKIQALACYKSQSHRPYMSSEFIRAQAIYNGIKCGKRYAEVFRIERLIN